jgi:hypothetical protein
LDIHGKPYGFTFLQVLLIRYELVINVNNIANIKPKDAWAQLADMWIMQNNLT